MMPITTGKPIRIIKTGTTSTFHKQILALEEGLPPQLRFAVLHSYRTLFVPTTIGVGPAEQVLSVAPKETVEIILESTRRSTIEQETQTETSASISTSSEDRTEKELTDRIASLIQTTSSSSSSASASGPISVINVSASGSSSFTETRTRSHETTTRTLRQTAQRVASEQSKRYTFRTRTVLESSSRELHRRVLQNESAEEIKHYALRKCFQLGTAAVQYIGPRLVIQELVRRPGDYLLAPRLVGPNIWPSPPLGMSGSVVRVDQISERKQLTPDHTFSGFIRYSQQAHILGALFANGEIRIVVPITEDTWSLDLVAEIVGIRIFPPRHVEIIIDVRKNGQTGTPPSQVEIDLPTISIFFMDQAQYSLYGEQFRVLDETDSGFNARYSNLIDIVSKMPRRAPADLRFEELDVLLRKASKDWRVRGNIDDSHYFSGISDILDFEASYYFLAPTGSKGDLGGRPYTGAYDVSEDSHPARLGAGIVWKSHFDGDDRRNEFLNSPSALLNIPVRRGQEQQALDYLQAHRLYTIEDDDSAVVEVMKRRFALEQKAQELGLSEDSTDLTKVSQSLDEENAPDDELAPALYPVRELVEFHECIEGFIYEPLSL